MSKNEGYRENTIPLEEMDSGNSSSGNGDPSYPASTRNYQPQQQAGYYSRNYDGQYNNPNVNPSDLENQYQQYYQQSQQQQQQQQQQDDNRTKSLRSLLSRNRSIRSGGGRRSQDPTSPQSDYSGNNNNNGDDNNDDSNKEGSYEEESKLLPTVEEEDEELPDLSDVVEDLKNDGQPKQRGYHDLSKRAKAKKKKESENKVIAKLRSIYTDLLSKTLLTRSFIYWLPLALILFIPLAVGAWGKHDASLGQTRIMWIFIWLEVVWGSLWICRFVAHVIPYAYEFLVGIISPSWRKYSTIFKAMEHALTLVLWALVSMITFMPIMTQNPKASPNPDASTQSWQKTIQNILVALLISSLVYFAERLLIHFISVSFHKTRFANRIKNNKLSIRVLSQLLSAAYLVFPPFCEEFEEDDLQLESGPLLNKGKNTNVIFARKIAEKKNVQKAVGAFNKAIGSAANALGNVGRDITGNSIHNSSSYNIVIEALGNKNLTEVLARRIWMSLVLEDAEELKVADLIEVLGVQYKDDAETVFEVLDADGNGNLTLDEMILSCKEIARERKTIYKSLRDVDSAISKLHQVLLFIVVLIMIIIFIGMLAPSVSAVLATLGTSILGLSFIFSPTAQEILGSCVFLFVKHPLDVGDMVEIVIPHSAVPTQLIVAEISLLFTVFRVNATGLKIQHSNATLNTLWIGNVSRAGPMSHTFNLFLGIPETSFEDLEKLKERLEDFIALYPRDYLPNPYYQLIDYPDLDRVQLCINITFKTNQEDAILFGFQRNRIIQFLGQCVNDIPLHIPRRLENYTDPTAPMFVSTLDKDQLEYGHKEGDDTDPMAPLIKNRPPRRNPMGFRKPVEYVDDADVVDEKKEWEQIPGAEGQTNTNAGSTTITGGAGTGGNAAGVTTGTITSGTGSAQIAPPETPIDAVARGEKLRIDTGVATGMDMQRYNSIASGTSSRLSRHKTITGRRQRKTPTTAEPQSAYPDGIDSRLDPAGDLRQRKTNDDDSSDDENIQRPGEA